MNKTLAAVYEDIEQYCHAKGYREGPGVNNFVPHDPVLAFAMAKHLIGAQCFDNFLVVAPEGHIYGYFFESLGCRTIEVLVPYPAVTIQLRDDLAVTRNNRILIIEDDVVSGESLRLVTKALCNYKPERIDLFLGHLGAFQHLDNLPAVISKVYLVDDMLRNFDYDVLECGFLDFFKALHQNKDT